MIIYNYGTMYATTDPTKELDWDEEEEENVRDSFFAQFVDIEVQCKAMTTAQQIRCPGYKKSETRKDDLNCIYHCSCANKIGRADCDNTEIMKKAAVFYADKYE